MIKVNLAVEHKLMRVISRLAMPIACASALVLSSVSPAFATLTCSAANVTLNYGSYNVLAGTVLNGAGTITVTCTKVAGGGQNTNGNVTYQAALTPLTPDSLHRRAEPTGSATSCIWIRPARLSRGEMGQAGPLLSPEPSQCQKARRRPMFRRISTP